MKKLILAVAAILAMGSYNAFAQEPEKKDLSNPTDTTKQEKPEAASLALIQEPEKKDLSNPTDTTKQEKPESSAELA